MPKLLPRLWFKSPCSIKMGTLSLFHQKYPLIIPKLQSWAKKITRTPFFKLLQHFEANFKTLRLSSEWQMLSILSKRFFYFFRHKLRSIFEFVLFVLRHLLQSHGRWYFTLGNLQHNLGKLRKLTLFINTLFHIYFDSIIHLSIAQRAFSKAMVGLGHV